MLPQHLSRLFIFALLPCTRALCQDAAPSAIPLNTPVNEALPAVSPANEISRNEVTNKSAEVPATTVQRSAVGDDARYLAGMPVSSNSSLYPKTQTGEWTAHARAMNSAFAQLEQRQLNNIRAWRSENLGGVEGARAAVYFFSGPDYLYLDTFFPNAQVYVMQGLEVVDPMPDLATVPPAALNGTLQNIEISLNTVLNFSFFKTKDMRQDFARSQLKGVIPIISVFLARTGKEITGISYISLDKGGHLMGGGSGSTRGVKISFVDSVSSSEKTLYYFTSDLSDDAVRRNPAVLRFTETLGGANMFLKAASYLMHEAHFDTIRAFILADATAILEDDSGIPVHAFNPEKWTLRFFGSYTAPIALFSKFYQADLRQYYASSAPKPLTFSFGYQWNRRSSNLVLATRK